MINAYELFYIQQKYFEINCYLEKDLEDVVSKQHFFQNDKKSIKKLKMLL